jgi:hypothetical protein
MSSPASPFVPGVGSHNLTTTNPGNESLGALLQSLYNVSKDNGNDDPVGSSTQETRN